MTDFYKFSGLKPHKLPHYCMGDKSVGSAGVSAPGSQGQTKMSVSLGSYLKRDKVPRGEAASSLVWIPGTLPCHLVVRPRFLFSCWLLLGFHMLRLVTFPHLQNQQQLIIVLSTRLASFHKSFVRLNEEIKSYFDKSGAMRLNILVFLMADLLMALRYIMVEINILLDFCFVLFFSLKLRL